MAKMIKLSTIKAPTLYIRQNLDPAHVADLQDVIKANGDKAYPFRDPIMVRKLAKPEKVKLTMTNKPGTVEYELIRGFNRCMALTNEKWTEASAEIVEAGDAEAFAAQYDDAEAGTVKKHDLADRGFYIKTLRDNFGWKLDQIGARMKLTAASISRILAGTQAAGGGKPRKKRSKNKAKNKNGNGATPQNEAQVTFVVSEFFSVLGELVSAYGKNKDAVLGFLDKVDPAVTAGAESMVAEMLGNR
jgi:ParB-like chromosome segregation protein Spo0J